MFISRNDNKNNISELYISYSSVFSEYVKTPYNSLKPLLTPPLIPIIFNIQSYVSGIEPIKTCNNPRLFLLSIKSGYN